MRLVVAILLMGALAADVAIAGGDPAAGKEKSQSCVPCHGADGKSPAPNFPILAGQYEDYLLYSLKTYKSGARTNAIMRGLVAALSEQDMKDLAAYFASQKGLQSIEVDYDFDTKPLAESK